MREIAELVLREVEARPVHRSGRRISPHWHDAVFRRQFHRSALSSRTGARDFRSAAHRERSRVSLRQDIGVSIMVYLALVLWPLGELDRARAAAEQTVARAAPEPGIPAPRSMPISTSRYSKCCGEALPEPLRHMKPSSSISQRARNGDVDCLRQIPGTVDAARRGECRCRPSLKCASAWRFAASRAVGNFMPFLKTLLAEAEAEAGELGCCARNRR